MIQRFLSIGLIFWLVLAATAQDESQPQSPLFAYFNQQLYILEGEALVEYPACTPDERMNGAIFPAPQGDDLLILTQPLIVSEALDELGTLGETPYGFNLWLCDPSSDSLERVYAQPGGDDPFTGEIPQLPAAESLPAWSPDGTQLAWTRLTFPDEIVSLMTLDLDEKTVTETALSIPPPPFPAPPTVDWSSQGMLLTLFTLDEETFLNVEIGYVYDPTAEMIVAETIIYDGGDDFINERLLLSDRETLTLALQYAQGGWALLDVLSGEQTYAQGVPYRTAGETGNRVLFDIDLADFTYGWQVAGTDLSIEGYPPARVALSPDGAAFAYADSTLHIWRDGIVTDIANSDGFADDFIASVVWAAPTYGFAEGAQIAEAPPPSCDGAPPSQFRAGDDAITTINLNVRDNPSIAANRIGELSPDTVITITQGPVCSDSYAWYQIESATLTGWVAEGTPDEYFLIPVR